MTAPPDAVSNGSVLSSKRVRGVDSMARKWGSRYIPRPNQAVRVCPDLHSPSPPPKTTPPTYVYPSVRLAMDLSP